MDPQPTLAGLDARMATLVAVLDRLGADLFDLDDSNPTRLILATAPLAGRTASRWAGADDTIALLWVLYGLARDTLERATERRGDRPRLAAAPLAELAAILTGPTVAVPPETVALAGSALAGAGPLANPCPVDALVDALSWGLTQVTTVVGEVTAVWDRVLPSLAELDAAATQIDQRAAQAGIALPNEAATARQALEQLRDLAARDPLAVDDAAIEQVGATLARVRLVVADRAQARTGTDARETAVAGALTELSARLDRVRDEQERSADRIVDGPDRAAEVAEARSQLDHLATDLASVPELRGRDPELAGRQVAQLGQRVEQLGRRVGTLADQVGVGLARRGELRGRLRAYQAKARVLGLGEDVELDGLRQRAADLLYAAPCDLDVAERAVEDYQRRLGRPSALEDR